MLLLAGEYERSLDQQNRLAIPAKLRVLLGQGLSGLYITPGMEHCLALYRAEELETELAQLADAPFSKENVRDFKRVFFRLTEFCEFDSQHRILIPDRLREWADLDSKAGIVLAGVQDHLEVWNPGKAASYMDTKRPKFDQLAEKVWEELVAASAVSRHVAHEDR